MGRGRRTTTGQRMDGARVLVTGGGSGIGRLMALEAARRGAEVIVWDLSAESAAGTVEAIRALSGRASGGAPGDTSAVTPAGVSAAGPALVAAARSVAVDVTDRDAVAAAAQRTGPVDVVVNNAGVVTGARLLEASEEAIRRTMEVNVLALYWVTRAFLGGMIERGHGTVVTIASAAGLVGVARQTDYSASKWAAVGFTESLRNELRADGHRIGTLVVCPYYIDTGMFAGVRTRFPRLLPILDPQRVSVQVIDAIEAGRRQLVLPPLVRVLPALRALPVGALDRAMDALGVNRTMDHFTGRPAAAQPPAKGGSTSTRESSRTG